MQTTEFYGTSLDCSRQSSEHAHLAMPPRHFIRQPSTQFQKPSTERCLPRTAYPLYLHLKVLKRFQAQ
jgi:hypothetical protein